MFSYRLREIFLLGYSGHAYVVINSFLSMGGVVKGYFETKKSITDPFRLEYCGDENMVNIKSIVGSSLVFPAVGDNQIRKNMVVSIERIGLQQTSIVDKSASIAKNVKIGHSSFIAPRAIINPFVEIGLGCIINTGAIVEHECNVGNFSHIAPGAILCGNVSIGTESFVGAGAIVKPGVKIGNKSVIGAGAVVLKDISDKETWVGNPARKIDG